MQRGSSSPPPPRLSRKYAAWSPPVCDEQPIGTAPQPLSQAVDPTGPWSAVRLDAVNVTSDFTAARQLASVVGTPSSQRVDPSGARCARPVHTSW